MVPRKPPPAKDADTVALSATRQRCWGSAIEIRFQRPRRRADPQLRVLDQLDDILHRLSQGHSRPPPPAAAGSTGAAASPLAIKRRIFDGDANLLGDRRIQSVHFAR
ncbi:MAG: hypothetical protein U1E43_00305 [Rhodospirillales bacterium]